jgi:uncharacterized protein YjcR
MNLIDYYTDLGEVHSLLMDITSDEPDNLEQTEIDVIMAFVDQAYDYIEQAKSFLETREEIIAHNETEREAFIEKIAKELDHQADQEAINKILKG